MNNPQGNQIKNEQYTHYERRDSAHFLEELIVQLWGNSNTIFLQYHVMFPAAETPDFLAESQQEIGLVPLLESNPYLTFVTNKQIVLVYKYVVT